MKISTFLTLLLLIVIASAIFVNCQDPFPMDSFQEQTNQPEDSSQAATQPEDSSQAATQPESLLQDPFPMDSFDEQHDQPEPEQSSNVQPISPNNETKQLFGYPKDRFLYRRHKGDLNDFVRWIRLLFIKCYGRNTRCRVSKCRFGLRVNKRNGCPICKCNRIRAVRVKNA